MGDYGVIIYIAIRYGQAIDGTSMNRYLKWPLKIWHWRLIMALLDYVEQHNALISSGGGKQQEAWGEDMAMDQHLYL